MMDERIVLQTKLQSSRQELLALLAGLNEAEWETAVYAKSTTWQVIDLLRHLTEAESSMTRLMVLIRDGGPGVPDDFDLDRWNASRIKKTLGKSTDDLLTAMAQNRTNLLEFMDALDEADWAKKGRHGSGRVLSIEEICHMIADHEAIHTADIRAALGK
ncbi:MAG: DinB family protein [Ardenticatenaceae bacterium]|nr:DinB family protein [Ardenticatenaceae bacterium]